MKRATSRERIALLLLVGLLPVLIWKMVTLEHDALYHPDMTDYPGEPMNALSQSAFKQKVQEVFYATRDGTRINAWYLPPQGHQPTVIFAHGNGGNLGDRWQVMELFAKRGYGFLAFDYRGYGKSEGYPCEKGLYQDMEGAVQYLIRVKKTPVSQQIAMGGSLGSGVVTEVASRHSFRAVILFATLTSTPAVADHVLKTKMNGLFRFLPTQYIMQQRFDSLGRIDRIPSPLLIMHGQLDEMMPLSMPKSLYEKAKAPIKKLLVVRGAGHNDVFFQGADQLFAELEAVLQETH